LSPILPALAPAMAGLPASASPSRGIQQPSLAEIGQPGIYELGFWFGSGRSGNPAGNSGSDYAVYAIIDQMLI